MDRKIPRRGSMNDMNRPVPKYGALKNDKAPV